VSHTYELPCLIGMYPAPVVRPISATFRKYQCRLPPWNDASLDGDHEASWGRILKTLKCVNGQSREGSHISPLCEWLCPTSPATYSMAKAATHSSEVVDWRPAVSRVSQSVSLHRALSAWRPCCFCLQVANTCTVNGVAVLRLRLPLG